MSYERRSSGMNMTVQDINQARFKIKFKGLDIDEVSGFLEIVRKEWEEILSENTRLKEQLKLTEQRLKEYRRIETAMIETYVDGNKVSEDWKSNARYKAELIIKEAIARATNIVDEENEKFGKIRQEISELTAVRLHFREEMTKLIEGHAKMPELADRK